jgi:hypothetical protein
MIAGNMILIPDVMFVRELPSLDDIVMLVRASELILHIGFIYP